MWPRAHRTLPVAWHGPHRPSGVRMRPVPSHAVHAIWRVTTTWRSTPRIDSSNVTLSDACTSAPASGRLGSAAGGCNTSAKSSPNVAASVPCAANEKSNPANSNAPDSTGGRAAPPAASYCCRRCGSLSVSYASAICLKNASAARSPGLIPG